MNRRRHRLCSCTTLAALALAVAGALAASAAADGLPVLGIDVGSKGVAARTDSVRYVTLPAGRETIVARTATHGGRVLGFTRLRGTFTVPAVAYDGSASGLSADGKTLVLIQPRLKFPRARTAFAVLDARHLGLLEGIDLEGDFSFDAISPRGRTLFLIEYLSARDPTRYHVRAYDLPSGHLLAEPVVDPRERGDAMRGSPLTRAASPDGRWAYTLYDGAGRTPFVHALDTSRQQARCIDLAMLAGRRDLWQLRLGVSAGGRSISVGTPTKKLASIDTTDFRVSVPQDTRAADRTGHGGIEIWQIAGAAFLAALLLAGAATLGRRRLRNRPPQASVGAAS